MNEKNLTALKEKYENFKETDAFKNRKAQLVFTEFAKRIIEKTLENNDFNSGCLTGLIQMLKANCSINSFNKYCKINIANDELEDIISKYHDFHEINIKGFTGAGLAQIDDKTEDQLQAIKTFLEAAFKVNDIKGAQELCQNYENQKIPEVTSGIYSPWLYYINPEIFPIKNSSSEKLINYLELKNNYPEYILEAFQIKTTLEIDDYGLLDALAFNLSEILESKTNEIIPITKNNNNKSKNPNMNKSLNQILYGPPGTGKTYKTIEKAIKIANSNFNIEQSRDVIKEEFNRLVKIGQIVFTTFHQSMSYEDFIEGIKPKEPENEGEDVIYKVELGIFRKLCIEAAFSIAKMKESKTTESVLDFSAQYDNYIAYIDERLLKNEEIKLETKSGGSVLVDSISPQDNIIIKHLNGTRIYTVSKARLAKLNSSIQNLDDMNNIHDQIREIIGGSNASAYWAVLNSIRKSMAKDIAKTDNRKYTLDDKIDVVNSLSNEDYKIENAKPYVLIIDEINRGNVSQIFGELITLIEEDKRLGKTEVLEITLPYSKKPFGVPPNLYIIGTMNTADRSVEALDTALRRRFSFEEMKPNEELINSEFKVGDYSLSKILETINKRIEVLLDKDHKIGHSYFMFKDKDDIVSKTREAFNKNIIPLLQEYFYGDYGKIGLVLGKGFIEPSNLKKENSKNIFAKFDYDDIAELLDSKIIYEIKYHNDDEKFKEAIIQLINNSTKTDAE